MNRTVIIGTGSYIPTVLKKNADFLSQPFYNEDGTILTISPDTIIQKFYKITGIAERRYAADNLNTSDLGTLAASLALEDSGIDQETLDLLIVAHNFGNVSAGSFQSDTVPALASRIKAGLKIKTANCIAFDTLFGCPGWIMGMIQADAFFKAGLAKRALVIGTETLSRVIDQFDRDSMIFSDGAGAAVIEYREERDAGIIASCTLSHSSDQEVGFLNFNSSNNQSADNKLNYIKMKGRKVYEYALTHVPLAMKECLEKSGCSIKELKKIFIHQANEKMDEAIVLAFYNLYGLPVPKDIMPMCIHWLGNSSVATIPTLFDLVRKGKDETHQIYSGDLVLFASVGAGMNINAICYRCP